MTIILFFFTMESSKTHVCLWSFRLQTSDLSQNNFAHKFFIKPFLTPPLFVVTMTRTVWSGQSGCGVGVLHGARLSVALVSSSSIRAFITGVSGLDPSLRAPPHSGALLRGRLCSHSGGDAHLQTRSSVNLLLLRSDQTDRSDPPPAPIS